MNFSVFINTETAKELEIQKGGFAMLKGVNSQIILTKVICDSHCPASSIRIPKSVQLSLAVTNGDEIPILPFTPQTECEAVQVAPLFEKDSEDYTQEIQCYFNSESRPISSNAIFTLRIGSQEKNFMLMKALPSDRTISSKKTKIYMINEPGPLLPRPVMSVKFPSLIFDTEVVDLVKNLFYYPTNNPTVYNALRIQTSVGVIVHGESGHGKTSFLSAVSHAVNIPSIYCDCRRFSNASAAELIEKIKPVFHFASGKANCLMMFDNIDSIITPFAASKYLDDKRKIALFIKNVDDLMKRNGCFLIATSSSLTSVEPSLMREGRFGYTVNLHAPTIQQRVGIIKLNTGGMKIDADDLQAIAENIGDGKSPREIEDLCRFAVSSMIEEVTGSSGCHISDSLIVYALNTKMRAVHFTNGEEEETRKRHRRRRRSRRVEDSSDPESDEQPSRHRRRRTHNQ